MTVVESTVNAVTVMAPLGARLDAAGCGEFRQRMQQAMRRGQDRFICDLSAVSFMDSTGLAVILSALRSLAGKGRLACAGLSPQVRKLFAVTKLDRGLVELFDSVEDALLAFGSSGGKKG